MAMTGKASDRGVGARMRMRRLGRSQMQRVFAPFAELLYTECVGQILFVFIRVLGAGHGVQRHLVFAKNIHIYAI